MRLNRLGLAAFGKFTDANLDFGDKPTDGPDLHILYGPNEAGKSTIYAAMLDFFFGIQEKSNFNFKHPYTAMRIEGDVAGPAGVATLARIKRRTNDLLDGADQPVTLNPFTGSLAGLDRDSYAAMFSLNEVSLTEGGKSLLAAEGDFGRILYGASAGLTDFGKELEAVTAEAEAFHKERARKTELKALSAKLDDLAKAKTEIDTLAPEYERLLAAKAAGTDALAEAEAAENAAQAALSQLQNQSKALDYLSEYKDIQALLVPLNGLPEAPAGLDAEITRLREEAATLNTQSADTADTLKLLEQKIGELTVDEAALSQKDALKTIADLEGRYRADARDLPRRLEEQTALRAEITTRSKRMAGNAVEDVRTLLLSPTIKGAVLDLADAWPALHARLQAAETEAENAALASSGDLLDVTAGAELEAALQAYEASDASARANLAADVVATRQRASKSAMAALAPWTGDIAKLRQITPPGAEMLSTWRTSLEESAAAIARAKTEVANAVDRAAEKQAEIDSKSTSIQSLDGQQLNSIMNQRDAAWATHRASLDSASADAFEHLLQETDAANAARFANASAGSDLAAAHEALSIANVQERAASKRIKDAELARKKTQSYINIFLEDAELKHISDVGQISDWFTARSTALATADALTEAEALHQAAVNDADSLQQHLSELLNVDASLPALANLTRTRLDADKAARAAAQQQAKRTIDLEKRQSEVNAWRSEWAAVLEGIWMAPMLASVQSVKAALMEHDELAAQITALDTLERRITGMGDNQAALQKGLSRIYSALDEHIAGLDPLDAYNALQTRVKDAETQNADRIRLQEDIDTATTRRRSLEVRMKAHHQDIADTLKSIDFRDLTSASQVIYEIQNRTELREKSSQAARAILDRVGGDDIAGAVASLDSLDRSTLAADLESAVARVQTAKAEALQSYTANRDAERALEQIGGDAAAAEITQRRQTVIEEITDGARCYLRLKLGAMAATEALEQYRASHQSGMLTGASKAFAQITRGAYSSLKTQAGGKGEELIAVTASGASRLDDKSMSTGTRAQLYLALRIAAYDEFAARQAPPPFVADDIFETFDDGRAEVTFQLLGKMAETGQVIYFTHHQHLKPIAERAVPGARWLDLTTLF